MGHRLSKIYTRTGDAGTTGLADGSRVAKHSLRVQAMGDLDELNSSLGVVRGEALPTDIATALLEIQHDLFDLGGELAIPGASLLPGSAIARLEGLIDQHNDTLPPLKEFVLPGGSPAGAACHLSRAICRRAERTLVQLAAEPVAQVNGASLAYVNRLSDLLFVFARVLARAAGGHEIMWDRARFAPPA
jgi:cob(I)alamin adenosyltransferase